jgi:hypothetical protein
MRHPVHAIDHYCIQQPRDSATPEPRTPVRVPSRGGLAKAIVSVGRLAPWLCNLVEGVRSRPLGGMGPPEDFRYLQQHFVLSKTELEEAEALVEDLEKERSVVYRVRNCNRFVMLLISSYPP